MQNCLTFTHYTLFFPTITLQIVPSLFSSVLPKSQATVKVAKMLERSVNERIAQLDLKIADFT